MRDVTDSAVRIGGRQSVLILMLAIAWSLAWPAIDHSSALMAMDEAARSGSSTEESATANSAITPASDNAEVPVPLQARNLLSYVARACGWFWGPAFLLLSFILIALIMMNLLEVRRDVLLPTQFVEEFEQKLNAKDFQGAYEFARSDDSFIGRVLTAGMGRLSRGYDEAVEGMQEAGEDANMALEHRLSYISLIGTIAPMMGLIGTVQGMISCFDAIGQTSVTLRPWQQAEGVSTALVTTLIGLILAIPAVVFHGIIRNRIQRLVLEIGMVSEGLMGRFAAVSRKQG